MSDRMQEPEMTEAHRPEQSDSFKQTFTANNGPQFVSTGNSKQYASYFSGSGTVHSYGGVAGDVIVQRGGPDDAPDRTYWAVDRLPTKNFTGRDNELRLIEDALDEALKGPSEQVQGSRCFVVWGMGGQGKSELCLHIAHRFRSRFWGVFWVDARTKVAADSDFSGIAASLSLNSDKPEYVRTFLANSERPWLLIFDNADNIDEKYEKLLPSNPNGVILMTSRIGACGQRFGTIGHFELLSLAQEDARDLLIKTANLSSEQAKLELGNIAAVAELLGYHTLALVQAGTYIAGNYCKVSEYPKHFEHYRAKVLSFESSSGVSSGNATVHTALEASLARLEDHDGEKYRDALDLMKLLSALPHHPVVMEQFEAAWEGARAVQQSKKDVLWNTEPDDSDVSALIPLVQADAEEWNSFRLRDACHVLTSVGLVSLSPRYDSEVISMHAITHAWAKMRLRYDKPEEPWELAGSFLVLSLRDANSWPVSGWVDMSEFSILYAVHIYEFYMSWPGIAGVEAGPTSPKLKRIDNLIRLAFFEYVPPSAFSGTVGFSSEHVEFQSLWTNNRWMLAMNRLIRESSAETDAAAKFMGAVADYARSLKILEIPLREVSDSTNAQRLNSNRSTALTSLFQQLQLYKKILSLDFSVELAACRIRNKLPAVAIDVLAKVKPMLEGLDGPETDRRRLHFSYVMAAACVAAERWNEAAVHLEKCQFIIHNSPNSRCFVVQYSLRPVLILKACCKLQDARKAVQLLQLLQREQSGSASPSCPRTSSKGRVLTAGVLALRQRDLDEMNASKTTLENMLADMNQESSSNIRQRLAERMTNSECWNLSADPKAMDIAREIIVIGGGEESTRECQTAEELQAKLQQWTERSTEQSEEGAEDTLYQEKETFDREKLSSYLMNILDELANRVHYPRLTT